MSNVTVEMPPGTSPQSNDKAAVPPETSPQSNDKAAVPPATSPQSNDKAAVPPATSPQTNDKAAVPPATNPKTKSNETVEVPPGTICGFSVEIGSKIIAWLSLMATVLFMVTIYIFMTEAVEMAIAQKGQRNGLTDKIVLYGDIILLVFAILFVIHASWLLYGVYEKNPRIIYFWITAIWKILMLLFLTVMIFIFIVAISMVDYVFWIVSLISGLLYGFGLYLSPVVLRFLEDELRTGIERDILEEEAGNNPCDNKPGADAAKISEEEARIKLFDNNTAAESAKIV